VRSKAQDLFKACHVLAEPSQNEFALFAARHFGTEKLEDEWICRLSNPPDRCFGSLNFQATQASAIDKRLWILSDGSTTKLCKFGCWLSSERLKKPMKKRPSERHRRSL
jgi:hypothetical protein